MEDNTVDISGRGIDRCRRETSYNRLTPVWEDKEKHDSGKDSKFVGCLNCHMMTEI